MAVPAMGTDQEGGHDRLAVTGCEGMVCTPQKGKPKCKKPGPSVAGTEQVFYLLLQACVTIHFYLFRCCGSDRRRWLKGFIPTADTYFAVINHGRQTVFQFLGDVRQSRLFLVRGQVGQQDVHVRRRLAGHQDTGSVLQAVAVSDHQVHGCISIVLTKRVGGEQAELQPERMLSADDRNHAH